MARFEIVMPKLGESIIEATITKWLKKEGDTVKEDESILEIATDKVDSEIPSPVEGKMLEILFKEGDVVAIGTVIAVIDLDGEDTGKAETAKADTKSAVVDPAKDQPKAEEKTKTVVERSTAEPISEPADETSQSDSGRFYSPLVKNIAKQENISAKELEKIKGTGSEGRLTKQDLLNYLETRVSTSSTTGVSTISLTKPLPEPVEGRIPHPESPIHNPIEDSIVEMTRIRQLIAGHMVKSVQTSPHVTSFVEVDMTKIVQWRDKHKDGFFERQGLKLTFTPVFVEAIAKAVKDLPQINVSVEGTKVIQHGNVHVGMAVSLPDFNLIVPVIKNADQKSLFGILLDVNDLADRARSSKLKPDEIMGGTISITNLGSVGTMAGTPIINQPQAAIVAVGSIKKRPVVMETPAGDAIVIRHIMILSLTFDHRVIDGALGGQFLNRMIFYLENFDTNQNL